LLAYSLPNREAPAGTGSASIMLLAGNSTAQTAVTTVSRNGPERYAIPAASAGISGLRERPVQVAVGNLSGPLRNATFVKTQGGRYRRVGA